MTQLTEDTFAVLNAVHLRKIATPDVVREISGLPAEEIGRLIDHAVAAGQIEDVGGMYMLSNAGTSALLTGYRDRYESLRTDADVLAWYERFERINKQFLEAISAWQTDGGADPSRLDKLLRLVERLVKAFDLITPTLPRYARYRNRFQAAMDRVDHGETEFVSSPTADSIHNIWFELHEDILTVIGRPRDVAEAEA